MVLPNLLYQKQSKSLKKNGWEIETEEGRMIKEREFGSENCFYNVCKGQLISKCPFGVFKSPKKPTKLFPGFLP